MSSSTGGAAPTSTQIKVYNKNKRTSTTSRGASSNNRSATRGPADPSASQAQPPIFVNYNQLEQSKTSR